MSEIPICLRKSDSSSKYYKYWTGGIILKSKMAVLEAVNLKLRLLRTDKITKKVEIFNYKTNDFEVLR